MSFRAGLGVIDALTSPRTVRKHLPPTMDIDWKDLPPALIDLLRGYATLHSPRFLRFPIELSFAQIHGFLLNVVLTNPYFATYPPAEQYQQQFWKWAIGHLESMSQEEA